MASYVSALQILAKEIVHSNKAISRLYVNKAQMISIQGALSEQLGASHCFIINNNNDVVRTPSFHDHHPAMVKVTGTLSKSADVMKLVNNLVKAPELAMVMQQMSQGVRALYAGLSTGFSHTRALQK